MSLRKPHKRKAFQLLSTRERAEAGVIVTFVNPETGERRVRHRAGFYIETKVNGKRKLDSLSAIEALQELVDLSETWGGEWKVQSISTPQTIHTDLSAVRTQSTKVIAAPEMQMLGQIGREDLWINGLSESRKRKRRSSDHTEDRRHARPARTSDADGGAAGYPGASLALLFGQGG